jgi:hypothetical protein
MEIRSYRRVFDLERRVYSVDSLRLNPTGVPVRGILYFVAILAFCLVVARLPLLGGAARAIPWLVRDLVLPVAGATLLAVIRLEGRAFHLAALALLGHRLGPRQLVGLQGAAPLGRLWHPDEILIIPDGSDSRLRHMRYTGPGAVRVSVPHERSSARMRATLTVEQSTEVSAAQRNQVILLAPGARMLVRAHRHGRTAR